MNAIEFQAIAHDGIVEDPRPNIPNGEISTLR
jgi:hypothetical protein